MKSVWRLLACAALAVALCCSATAQERSEFVFSGTRQRPQINGSQLGMSLPMVMLWEKEQGRDFQFKTIMNSIHGIDELSETSLSVAEFVSDSYLLLEEPVHVKYRFELNTFSAASCKAFFADEDEAWAFSRRLKEHLWPIYGHFDGAFLVDEEDEETFSGLGTKHEDTEDLRMVEWNTARPIINDEWEEAVSTWGRLTVEEDEGVWQVALSVGIYYLRPKGYTEYYDARFFPNDHFHEHYGREG